MPFVKRGQDKLFYQVQGEGPAVICIHDLFEDHLFWEKISETLSSSFTVVTVDLRGIGQSSISKEAFKVEDLVQDVIAVADELKLESFCVIGDSMGGIVAQLLARKNADRVKRLVLSNSYTHLTQVNQWSIELAIEIFEKNKSYDGLYQLLMPWYFASRYFEREQDAQELVKSLKNRKHPSKPKGLKMLFETIKEYDSTKNLKYIKANTLVIIAEEDIFCLFRDSRAMIKAIEKHQVELVSGGHNSKIEHPNRFCEVVTNFFQEPEPEEEEPKKD